jgi:hypothetical protein
MDRRDIMPEQAQKMVDRLRPTLGYLPRLAKRIDAEGFPHDDPLRRQALAARQAMKALTMTLHYLTCDNVGDRGR